jgi:hypothetical protein
MLPHTDGIMDMFPHTGDIHNGVSGHVETVVLLSQLRQKPDDYIDETYTDGSGIFKLEIVAK